MDTAMIIPSIEDIVTALIAGDVTEEQALTWLQQHVDNTDLRELRDGMAMAAMEGLSSRMNINIDGADIDTIAAHIAAVAYRIADAMMKARGQ